MVTVVYVPRRRVPLLRYGTKIGREIYGGSDELLPQKSVKSSVVCDSVMANTNKVPL